MITARQVRPISTTIAKVEMPLNQVKTCSTGSRWKSAKATMSTAAVIVCTIDEVCGAAGALLKNGGRVAMVYPAPRMLQLMTALRAHRMEPKRVRIVQDRPGAVPKLVLIDAVKGGGEMLHWMAPLVLKEADGVTFTEEWHKIYRRSRKTAARFSENGLLGPIC